MHTDCVVIAWASCELRLYAAVVFMWLTLIVAHWVDPNLLTSSSSGVLALFFPHEISFYASFEAYSCTDNGLVEDSVRFVGTDS